MITEKVIARFNKKLMAIDKNGCIYFKGEILCSGYGRMCINYQKIVAHRIAWTIKFGRIPNNLCVLHKCDNRLCVNTDHLFLGSNKDNIKDKISKNRQQKGEQVILSKLKEFEVLEIRKLLYMKISQAKIARKFKVSKSAIEHIHTNRTWKHITLENSNA